MLPPVDAPAEWTGTAEEWTDWRGRIVADQAPDVRAMSSPDWRAHRASVIADADRARRASDAATELRQVEAKYGKKG